VSPDQGWTGFHPFARRLEDAVVHQVVWSEAKRSLRFPYREGQFGGRRFLLPDWRDANLGVGDIDRLLLHERIRIIPSGEDDVILLMN
jgi:hypothetical protein